MASSDYDQHLHVHHEDYKKEMPAIGQDPQHEGQKAWTDEDLCGD
jgi:hypothetical protein